MNHVYRLVWNELNSAWVAVAEIAKGRGKRSSATVGHAPGSQCRRGLRGHGLLAASLALIGAPSWALDVNALPTGGKVVAGAATISQAANVLTVQQASQRAALDWQSFNIGAAATVNFIQPSSSAVALNRIVGNEASQIYGKLNSNGQVFFSNPNGMLFARGAQVNVGGILATTMKLGNEDFMAGNYRLTNPGSGAIRNEGLISALGSAALVGSTVQNAGQIIATTVTLAAGNTVAVDLSGDGLIRARVEDAALKASIENSGGIDGASVAMTTGQARDTLDRVVNNSGVVRATGLASINGEIVLEGGWVANTGILSARNVDGGGGRITLSGTAVAVGGTVAADGATQGGGVVIDAHGVSLAGRVSATGGSGAGGTISIQSATNTLDNTYATLDASGATGGTIREIAGHQITSSATYVATGSDGRGGNIDLSAPATKLLSAQLDASGATGGGQVRLGGEYQGGRNLTQDELANAETLAVSAGSVIKVDATRQGDGGTAILWSDVRSVLYPRISARSAGTGSGGLIELSSGDTLSWGGQANAGPGGRVLFDPKNIVIQNATSEVQYNLVLGFNYVDLPRFKGNNLQGFDQFGYAVSLSGTQLAVGAPNDMGADKNDSSLGAVYLFNNPFTTPTLKGIIGRGYSGTGNYNLVGLETSDFFGRAVSLAGNRLLVGAPGDDGYGISPTTASNNFGAVYLFNNIDTTPTLAGTIGKGYTGSGTYDLSKLIVNDSFGSSVSLSGTRLAAGAPSDKGAGGGTTSYGAAYLFNNADTTPTLAGILGMGYTGSGDVNLPLGASDSFGASVSLDGTRLAVGASLDDGSGNTTGNSGAVYLFKDLDTTPTLSGMIGKGYTGTGSYNLALETSDTFGISVSLSGTQLVVGATGDDGFGIASTTNNAYGAVYLFKNLDTTPTLSGTIGKGYTGTGNYNLTLDTADSFGRGVSLAGTQLAVGAQLDDGSGIASSTNNAYGAVYLLNNPFGTTTLSGIIGKGYSGAGSYDVSTLPYYSYFGSSVSLSGTQLAVGAPGDQGVAGGDWDAGAVYLFDNPYTTPTLKGIIGLGYTGTGNVNLGALESGDRFGASVSLSGTRLAVGALYDAGAGNAAPYSGAVYLFNTLDATPTLAGTLGVGYTGSGDVDLTGKVEAYDYFGAAVSLDGNRLAVGAPNDGGFENGSSSSGAVHLFKNLDTTPVLSGTLGVGYTGSGDLDLTGKVEGWDTFGTAVSLSGTRLAVGANGDGGYNNIGWNLGVSYGAVHLFKNLDTTPSFTGTIGVGYGGVGSLDLSSLEGNTGFGAAVSLSGTQLAVGAPSAPAYGGSLANAEPSYGAVFLFNNIETTPAWSGTIGKGYTGAGNYSMSMLNVGDAFGSAVSLAGSQLAIGAPNDNGAGGMLPYSGAVHLMTLGTTLSASASQTFAADPGSNATITPASLTDILKTGATVILQANNDITVASPITVNLTSGMGGALTLQAGRSIQVNARIDTAGGALTLVANDAGAVAEHRDAGAAVIDASLGTLKAGAMQFTNTGGNILLNNVTATGATISDALGSTTLTGSNSFTSFDAQSGGVSSAGALTVGGGTTALTGALSANGLGVGASGTLNALSGATVNTQSFTNAGTLMGTGTVTVAGGSGTLANTGVIAPGDSAGAIGTLTLNGNLDNVASAVLKLDLNGTAAGSYDKLVVSGSATFAAGSSIDLMGTGGAGAYPVLTAAGGVTSTPTVTGPYFTASAASNANDVTVTASANLIESAILWDGGANTLEWADAANWSSDAVPTSADNVFINATGQINISSGARAANNLVSLTDFSLADGSLTLAGIARLNKTTYLSAGTLTSTGVTIPNGGVLYWWGGTVDAPLTAQSGSITHYSGGTLAANRAWTSSGTLNLAASMTLASLPVFSRAGGSVNLTGSLDNTGSTLDLGSAGIFGSGGLTSLSGSITGGTLQNTDVTPALVTSGIDARLYGVTLAGSALTTSGTLNIANGITLADGVTVTKGADTWNFLGSGTQHIATPGTATLINTGGTFVTGVGASNTTLQIDSGVTIQGYGTLTRQSSATIVNAGTIAANVANQSFTISPSTFTNNGTLELSAGSATVSATTFNQAGNIKVAPGTSFSASSFTNSGTLSGGGTIVVGSGTGTLTNARYIAPDGGAGPTGTLTINGNLANTAAAVIYLDLNGTAAGSYDKLAVTGTTSFAAGSTLDLMGSGGAGSYAVLNSTGAVSGTPTVANHYFTQTAAVNTNDITVDVSANQIENALFWDGGASTWNWTDAANWSSDTLPTAADNVFINAGGLISISAGTLAGNNLYGLTDFALSGGSLNLAGTATFNKNFSISGGSLSSTGVTIPTGGVLNWTGGTISGPLNTQTGSTTNLTAGALGGGNVWAHSGALNLTGAMTVTALPAFTRSGGSVNLTGVLDNSNNTLDIGNAGFFGTGGLTSFTGTIKGGAVRNTDAAPTLAASGSSATLDGVTLDGTVLTTSGTLNIANGITLANGITVSKGSTVWNITGSGTQHIATSGTATLASAGGSIVAGVGATGQTLQIDSGVTIQGYGALTQGNTASIVNAGTLRASTSGQTLSITPDNFLNTGALNVAGGTLTLAPVGAAVPNWTNSGTINLTTGTLNLGGQVSTASLGTLNRTTGATLNLTGTLDNTNATLDVGSAGPFGAGGIGTFSGTITGGTVLSTNASPNLTGSNGTLDGVTFGGSTLSTYGTLNIYNNLTLANGLTVGIGSGAQWRFMSPGTQHIATPGTATINNSGGSLLSG